MSSNHVNTSDGSRVSVFGGADEADGSCRSGSLQRNGKVRMWPVLFTVGATGEGAS